MSESVLYFLNIDLTSLCVAFKLAHLGGGGGGGRDQHILNSASQNLTEKDKCLYVVKIIEIVFPCLKLFSQ